MSLHPNPQPPHKGWPRRALRRHDR